MTNSRNGRTRSASGRLLRAGGTLALAAGLAVLAPMPSTQGLTFLAAAEAGTAAVVDSASIARLGDAMHLPALFAVIREEGLSFGDGLDEQFLKDEGGVSWAAEVARIYDPAAAQDRLQAVMLASFTEDPTALTALQNFFASPLGAKVATGEVAARRAFLDPAAKDDATVAWLNLDEAGKPRARAIDKLITEMDLVDLNVQGMLNANLSLYRGLVDGGGLTSRLTDGDAMAAVAGQEPQVRASAKAWLYPYLALAYSDLSDAELQSLLDFLTSPEGQKANLVMFHAYDTLFSEISHDLGLAVSQRLAGSNI